MKARFTNAWKTSGRIIQVKKTSSSTRKNTSSIENWKLKNGLCFMTFLEFVGDFSVKEAT